MQDVNEIGSYDQIILHCRSGFRDRLAQTSEALGMPMPDIVEMLVDCVHGQLRNSEKIAASDDGLPLDSQSALVAQWKTDRTKRNPGGHVFLSTGYTDFCAYAERKGVAAISRELFAEKLTVVGLRRKRVTAGSIIIGRSLLS